MTREEAISWFENRMKNTTMPGARSMFAMALDALREQEERRWIPVTERLPTIHDADDDNCVLAIHKASNKRYYHWRTVVDNPFDFTHWMQVPLPQKEDDYGIH